MADVIRAVADRIGRTTDAALRTLGLGGSRSTFVLVAADPDAALMATAAALRRMGARITRYDAEDAALEARLASALVAVRASGAGVDVTNLEVSTDAPGGRRLLRRFRRELAEPTGDARSAAQAGAR
jgi:hypothetical protein